MSDEVTSALARCTLFEDLTEKELKAVAALTKERRADPDEVIAEQGSGGIGFFVVGDGTARIERDGRPLGQIGPGGSFGEVALLDNRGNRRSASVIAETPMTLYAMSAWAFRPMLEENGAIAIKIATGLARMLNDVYAAQSQAAKA